MINTRLEKLFDQYNFSLKDRYDFSQIFSLLPDYKKKRVVDRFDEIVSSMQDLRGDLILQQEILFGEALENIESKLQQIQVDNVVSRSKRDISDLKNVL